MPANDEEVLTVPALEKRWRCGRKAIYDAIRAGRLTAFRIGDREWRITLEEVRRFERERSAKVA